jgi:predicted phosphodiesterase
MIKAKYNWTKEEEQILIDLATFMSTNELIVVLEKMGFDKRGYDSVASKCKVLGLTRNSMPISRLNLNKVKPKKLRNIIEKYIIKEEDNPYHNQNVKLQPNSLSITRDSYKEILKKKRAELETILNELPTYPVSKKELKPGTKTLCVALSDWHCGEYNIDPLSGDIIFSSDILQTNIADLTEAIIRMAKVVQRGEEIDKIVLICIGDFATGEMIFPNQQVEIDIPAIKQVEICRNALWQLIITVNKETSIPIEIVTVAGNHGRLDMSPDTNLDNFIYLELESMIKASGRTDITIKTSYDRTRRRLNEFNEISIRGWKFLLLHKGYNTTKTSVGRSKYMSWTDGYDAMVVAHFHSPAVEWLGDIPVIFNGAVAPYGNYARRIGAIKGTPSQYMWCVSDEYIMFYETILKF